MVTPLQEFDATWFLPPTSYLRQWFTANNQYFPSTGERCHHCAIHEILSKYNFSLPSCILHSHSIHPAFRLLWLDWLSSVFSRVKIYFTGLDLADEMDSLDKLVTSLNNATDIVASVDSWWTSLNSSLPKDRSNVTHELFNQKLTQFLHG